MILQALNAFYERLKRNPKIEMALPGFAVQKVHFALVLAPDGKLEVIS
jgi:hypothetical protein